MTDLILHQDIESLVESWFKAEREGNPFPVPFDTAWPMAGYSRKDSAKRNGLKGLIKGEHYSTKKWSVAHSNGSGASAKELIELSMAGFEHLCLMADTPEGKAVRDLYRQAKHKWDLLQKQYPSIAQEIELQHLRNEGLKLENQRIQSELQLAQFRHTISTTLPEPIQQKILGYKEIKTTEYVPQTITPEGERLDGCGITYLQKRYGFKSTSATWAWLDSIGFGKESGYWQDELVGVTRPVLPRGILGKLDDLSQGGLRQRFFGE